MMSSRESESAFNGLNGMWLCFPVGCLWKFKALLFGGIVCLSLSNLSSNRSLAFTIWQCVKTLKTPVVHIKIAGLKWMFIPLKMDKNGMKIGIDP